ncbi:integrase [Neobacillus drentensis]
MLLSKAWELYESDKRIEGFSPQTLKAYRLQSKLQIEYFKDMNIGSMTTEQLKGYLSISNEYLKPSVFLIRYGLLNQYFVGPTRRGIYPKIQL